jgi:N-methylhydantoinase A
VTVKKGLDPRSYTMVAFGGSGPLQAPHVAELLGMDAVLIPPNPGNVSAFGLLAVDLKADFVVTSVHREDRVDLQALDRAFSRLEQAAAAELEAEGVPQDRRRLTRSADLRYFGEAYEVRIDVPPGDATMAAVRAMTDTFHSEHERIYGYSYQGQQLCEIVNLRVSAIGLVDRPRLQSTPTKAEESTLAATPVAQSQRSVYLVREGFVEVPVYSRDDLSAGHSLSGPSVIEEYGSTSIVPAGWSLEVDGWRNVILRKSSSN